MKTAPPSLDTPPVRVRLASADLGGAAGTVKSWLALIAADSQLAVAEAVDREVAADASGPLLNVMVW